MKTKKHFSREAFITDRLMEFFTEPELTTQIGYPKKLWPLVMVKELIDNAIDACETATTGAIEISIELKDDAIIVSDNGPVVAGRIASDYRGHDWIEAE